MNRAQLFLWSLLHSDEHVDDGVLAELADQGASHLSLADKEQRRSDMEAAVGVWAARFELPDSRTYIEKLRNEVRGDKLVPA